MSISYTPVDYAPILKKAALYGAREFYYGQIDPATVQQLQLPADYKFGRCFLPKKYVTTIANRVLNFESHADDVWTVSFPKAGTTWTMNIVWQLKNNLNFAVDYIDASYMFLERAMFYDITDDNKNDDAFCSFISECDKTVDDCADETGPRLLKSHLPAYLLPKDIWRAKSKVIYIYRNAKDVAISMYHMLQEHLWLRYLGTMQDFFDAFLNDHVVYGPYFDHINSYRQLKQLDHVLLISYEEMLANPFDAVKQISNLLNCSYTDEQLQLLTEHVSFHNMYNVDKSSKLQSPRPNKYGVFSLLIDFDIKNSILLFFRVIRKSKTGRYHDEMSPEYVSKFDDWERQQFALK